MTHITHWLPTAPVPQFPDQLTLNYNWEVFSELTGMMGTLLEQEGGGYFDIDVNYAVDSFFDVYFSVQMSDLHVQHWQLRGEVMEPGLLELVDVLCSAPTAEAMFDLSVTMDLMGDPNFILPDAPIFSFTLAGGVGLLDGDANCDRFIDVADLGILSAQWGTMGAAADFNADLLVDVGDLAMLSANWGRDDMGGGGGLDAADASVPLPASGGLAIALLGGLSLCRRRA